MTAQMWINTGFGLIAVLLGSAVVTTLIKYKNESPLIKANTAKAMQETKSIEIDDQTQIMADMRTELARVNTVVDKLNDRVDKLEQSNEALVASKEQVDVDNKALREALTTLLQWCRRSFAVLTAEQARITGPPPDVDHIL